MSDDEPRRRQVSVRLPVRLLAELEREAERLGISRSDHIRRILSDRHEADKLSERLERREERIEDLEDQLRKRSKIEDRVDELAIQLRDRDDDPDPPWPVRWWRWFRDDG